MLQNFRERRRALGVSLDELAIVLGSGFSRGRLSLVERGLVQLSEPEHKAVTAAIERIGALRADVRRIVERSQSVNILAGLCRDIREGVQAAVTG